MRSVAKADFAPPAFRMNMKPAMPATASRTGTVSMGPVIGVSARRAHACCGCRQVVRRQCVILTGGGLHAAPQPIGCGGSVRRHDGPRPRCSTAKNGSFVTRPPRRNQRRVEPCRATEEPPTFARPPLRRASTVVRALPRADGHRTCGSPALDAHEHSSSAASMDA